MPVATVGGQYEYSFFDGVPYLGQALASNAAYFAATSMIPGQTTTPVHIAQKTTCQPELFVSSLDQSGDMTPFWAAREYRPGAGRIRVPTLMVHGLADFNVKPLTQAGFFERLAPDVPKALILGQWGHDYPDGNTVVPDWSRQDFYDATVAWFDRHLKGLPSGTEDWPVVQVQDSTGQWRAEPDWPFTRGPAGQLALGPAGVLGATAPSGSTTYVEGIDESGAVPGSRAVFETAPLAGDLHLTGQPALDLWVTLDRPDAHLAAKLERITPDGELATPGVTYGYRSMRHLAALRDNRFAQERGETPPAGVPLRVTLRFLPADVRVPKGWRLRLTLAGSVDGSEPSGMATGVTILHDCEHRSALRFLMPGDDSALLNVREADEDGAPAPSPAPAPPGAAGGLATARVCGHGPQRLAMFGPAAAPPAPAAGRRPVAPRRRRLAVTVEELRLRGRRQVLLTVSPEASAVHDVTAVLRRSRRGRVLASRTRRTDLPYRRTLVLRVRKGVKLQRGRYVVVLAGRNPDGAPGQRVVSRRLAGSRATRGARRPAASRRSHRRR